MYAFIGYAGWIKLGETENVTFAGGIFSFEREIKKQQQQQNTTETKTKGTTIKCTSVYFHSFSITAFIFGALYFSLASTKMETIQYNQSWLPSSMFHLHIFHVGHFRQSVF